MQQVNSVKDQIHPELYAQILKNPGVLNDVFNHLEMGHPEGEHTPGQRNYAELATYLHSLIPGYSQSLAGKQSADIPSQNVNLQSVAGEMSNPNDFDYNGSSGIWGQKQQQNNQSGEPIYKARTLAILKSMLVDEYSRPF